MQRPDTLAATKSAAMNQALIITDRSQLLLLPAIKTAHPQMSFMAGAKSLETQMLTAGYEPLSPDKLCNEARQQSMLTLIVGSVDQASRILEQLGLPEGQRALIALELLRALSFLAQTNAAAKMLEMAPMVLVGDRLMPPGYTSALPASPTMQGKAAGSTAPSSLRPPILPLVNPFGRPFVLDLRAANARTPPSSQTPPFVRLTATTHASAFGLALRNAQQGLRTLYQKHKASRLKLRLGQLQINPQIVARLEDAEFPIDDEGVEARWIAMTVAETLAAIASCKQAIDGFLDRYGSNLALIALDSPVKPLEVALAQAAQERGIPCVEESHGCMVVHGGGARQDAATIMAGGGYNWIPDVPTLVPRSKIQARAAPADKSLLAVNRVVPFRKPSDPRKRPFRVLYAPNFMRWHMAVPAFTATCFETFDMAAALARLVAAHPGWHLDIRIKVAVNDTPTANQMAANRGLTPPDVEPLFALAGNVRNASGDSFSRNLEDADLVITEGVTAVMIEALEYRTPVLLLNRSPDRISSMPAWRHSDLATAESRNATYAASIGAELEPVLGLIEKRHKGKPLTDAELQDFCWVEAPPHQPHYLQSLLVL